MLGDLKLTQRGMRHLRRGRAVKGMPAMNVAINADESRADVAKLVSAGRRIGMHAPRASGKRLAVSQALQATAERIKAEAARREKIIAPKAKLEAAIFKTLADMGERNERKGNGGSGS